MDVEDGDSNEPNLGHIRTHSVSPTFIIQLDGDVSAGFILFCKISTKLPGNGNLEIIFFFYLMCRAH